MILRRAELAKMRSLLFFKEQKQKKIAKIKSKTYRKIAKKAAEKNNVEIDLEQLGPERAKEERERIEFERAKERMTLKHKNTGKWAKRILGRFESSGSTTHKAIMEQLEKGEALRQRISGLNSDSDDSNDVESALNELQSLEEEIQHSSNETVKGVFGMKFMQKDINDQKDAVKNDILEARREILGIHPHNDNDENESHENQSHSRHNFEKNVANYIIESSSTPGNYANDEVPNGFEVTSLPNLLVQPSNVFTVESFGKVKSVPPKTSKTTLDVSNDLPVVRAQEIDSAIEKNYAISYLEEPILEKNSDNAWFDDSAVTAKKTINQPYSAFEKESRSKKSLSKIASKKALLIASDRNISDDEVLLEHHQNASNRRASDHDFASDIDLVHSSHIHNLTNSDIMKMAFSGDSVIKVGLF
jgi:U3 small nucleolar RNA-associated protein 14